MKNPIIDFDVDIDTASSFNPLDHFPTAINGSQINDGVIKKHNSGVYFQKIHKDKITGLSAIPFKEAEKLGYFKMDFLHLTLLDHFTSKEEIRELIKIPPDWSLLEDQENVERMSQIHRHFDIVYKIKPKSVNDISDIIALIRPGKRMLVDAYVQNKEITRKELYKRPEDSSKYYFKQSHAIAYALNIVLQLHLLKSGII